MFLVVSALSRAWRVWNPKSTTGTNRNILFCELRSLSQQGCCQVLTDQLASEPGNQIVQDNLVLCAGGWPRLLAMLIQCLKREERQEDLEQRGFGYQKLPDLVLSLVKSMEEARLPPMPSSETVEKILSLRRHQGGRVPDALQFWSEKMPQVRGMVESG